MNKTATSDAKRFAITVLRDRELADKLNEIAALGKSRCEKENDNVSR